MKKPQKVLKKLNRSEMKRFAQTLANRLKKSSHIIGLVGELGSGKTFWSKAFGQALGATSLASPSFIIRRDHSLPQKGILSHWDLYRVNKKTELTELGWPQIKATPQRRLILVEWADKIPKIQRQCDLVIKFKFSKIRETLRDVEIY